MADPTTTRPEEDDTQIDTPQEDPSSPPAEPIEEAEVLDDAAPQNTASETAPQTPANAEAPAPVETRRGPGFVPLMLGGVIAAGLGYGAAVMGLIPAQSADDTTATTLVEIQQGLGDQTGMLTALSDRTAALEGRIDALPPVPAPVDLSPLSAQIEALGARIDGTGAQISGLTDRIAYLETLPLGETGGADNSAAVAAAVAQLQAALDEQSSQLDAARTASAALAEEVGATIAAAEARIAEAEARAEARVNASTAQAALGQLRIAVASGAPFAGALTDVANGVGTDVPEGLTTAAETGVPTLDDLRASFPAAARAALPVAIRETAGEGTMNRVTAFLQSQVGGRSLEPQGGDSPDAVLSRAEAAVRDGDLATAVTEIGALPAEAQAEMADWSEAAQTRIAALEALDAFAAALDTAN